VHKEKEAKRKVIIIVALFYKNQSTVNLKVRVLKDFTMHPCGLMQEKTWRIVPSLPEVSIPSRMIIRRIS